LRLGAETGAGRFHAPIYATSASAELVELVLRDAAEIKRKTPSSRKSGIARKAAAMRRR